MQLRPYQLRARAEADDAIASGARALLYVAPTGAGKAVVLADHARAHLAATPGGTVNVYVHRMELRAQLADTFRRCGMRVGSDGLDAAAPVQVLSTQGVLAGGEVRACSLALLDEAHHYAADDWGRVPKAHADAGAIVVGASATPERGDGRGLDFFSAMVVVAQPRELVDVWRSDASQGLVPCEVIRPSRKVPRGKLAQSPARAHATYARGRRNIVFAPHVKAANDFAREFADGGVRALVVTGTMPRDEREDSVARFRAGDVRVLVNVACLTEGLDIPALGVVTVARDCGSTGLYIQMAGRGARPHPGKLGYTVLDLRGVSYLHGRPDDDRDYSLEGVGISRGTGVLPGERLCLTCGAQLGDMTTCARCGKDHALQTPGDAGIELESWKVAMRTEPVDKRAVRLAKWLREARAKGHKVASAYFKYKAVYNHWPDAGVRAAAERGLDEH